MSIFSRKKQYQLPRSVASLAEAPKNAPAPSAGPLHSRAAQSRVERLGSQILNLPIGVELKRSETRDSVNQNKWRAKFHGRSQVYYGRTPEQALNELFRVQTDVGQKYLNNARAKVVAIKS